MTKTVSKIFLSFILTFPIIVCSQDIDHSIFNIYFEQDFENNSIGNYLYSEWLQDWNYPKWNNRQEETDICIPDNDLINTTKRIKGYLPVGTFGAHNCGWQWESYFDTTFNELYFSYDIRFKPGFNWVLGGKIPGLKGGEKEPIQKPEWDEGFTASLMFKEEGKIVFYTYHQDQPGQYGESIGWKDYITTGVWHNITIRVVINTIGSDSGNYDGILEGFYDGKLSCQKLGMRFRNLNTIGIDAIKMYSFFGGGTEEWAALRDEWIEIDNVVAFTYKDDINVPRGNNKSPSDRILLHPFLAIKDSVWKSSLSGEAITSSQIRLDWDYYPIPSSYTIERKAPDDTNFVVIENIAYNNISFTDNGLSPLTNYTFRISANDKYTHEVQVSTPEPSPPVRPSQLTTISATISSISLSWKDNSTDETGFYLVRSLTPDGPFNQIVNLSPNTSSYTDNNLNFGTTYYYRVRSYNNYGNSAFTAILSANTSTPPTPHKPSNLSASQIDKHSILLNWEDNATNEIGFRIYRSDDNGASYTQIATLSANTTNYLDENLSPEKTYFYRVLCYSSYFNSGYSNILQVATLPLELPNTPSSLNANFSTINSVGLSWIDNSFDETGFVIYRSTWDTTNFSIIDTIDNNKTNYTDNILLPKTEYYYYISAINYDGLSDKSNMVHIYTSDTIIPAKPSNLTAKNILANSVTISWNDNSYNEQGSIIERSVNNNPFEQIGSCAPNISEYTDIGLSQVNQYLYRVYCYNEKGNSALSDTLLVETFVNPPNVAPTNLIIKYNSADTILLNWKDNSSNEDAFCIERSIYDSLHFIEIARISANNSYYLDLSFINDTNYYYRVRAYNTDGYSGYSNNVSLQTLIKYYMVPPSGLTVLLDSTSSSIILSWTDIVGETGYEIERTLSLNDNFIYISTADSNTTKYKDQELFADTTYFYRIRAINSLGFSRYSDITFTKTLSSPILNPPSNLKATDISISSITLTWADNSKNEEGFIIERYTTEKGLNPVIRYIEKDHTTFIDNNLKSNTTYYYSIQAITSFGASEQSNTTFVTTKSLAESKRVKDGLVLLYNFDKNSEQTIFDYSNYEQPCNIKITDTINTIWSKSNKLNIVGNTVLNTLSQTNKIIDACKETNEISIELWIKPNFDNLVTSSYIISLSKNSNEHAFVLSQENFEFSAQQELNYGIQLRTNSTTASGLPKLCLDKNIDYITLNHIIYTKNEQGYEKLYFNGDKLAEGYRPDNFDVWNGEYKIIIGNDSSLSEPWNGTYYLLAIYNKYLTTNEIEQNYQAGPADKILASSSKFDLLLYPNPTHSILQMEITSTETFDYAERTYVEIVDLLGNIHYKDLIPYITNNFNFELDCSFLKNGIYFIRIGNTNGYSSAKFILQKL